MDQVQLAPFAVSPEELIPIVFRQQARAVSLIYILLSVAAAGVYVRLLNTDWMWLIIPFLFPVAMLYYRYVGLPRTVRKLDKLMFSTRQVVFTRDSWSITYESGLHTTMPWRIMKNVKIVNGIYLLFLPAGTFLQLPRRAMNNDEEHYLIDRLREVGLMV